jgi:hypothetical protein
VSTIDVLYKYGRVGPHSEALFSTGSIFLPSPATLNDPFECRPWFTFNGSREQVLDTFARLFKKLEGLSKDAAIARAEEAYRGGQHADPAAWAALRKSVIDLLAEQIGMCCLSRVPDSILMWAHYGAQHAGYCIEFEATDETPLFGAAQPVTYSDSHPVVDFYNTPNNKQVELMFLTKYLGWAYEQEWRVIDHDHGPGVRDYPSELMKTVIFGLRMPPEQKMQIREWVARRENPVRLLQATQDDQQFAIRLVEANDA